MWFEGECSSFTPLDVIESRPGFVRLRAHDTVLNSVEEKSISWSSDFMYLPLGSGTAHEVFRRVRLSEVVAAHPCLQAELERGG